MTPTPSTPTAAPAIPGHRSGPVQDPSGPVQSRAHRDTPVGAIEVLGGPSGIRSVQWRTQPGADPTAAGPQVLEDCVRAAITQLEEYFAGTRREFDLPLDLTGLEPATRAVLAALQAIPYGTTVTYGELARRSGTGLPPRAIGSVMGGNPVPLLVPCHRVVAGDGLGGYSGGEPGRGRQTKLWLLEFEGALPPTLI